MRYDLAVVWLLWRQALNQLWRRPVVFALIVTQAVALAFAQNPTLSAVTSPGASVAAATSLGMILTAIIAMFDTVLGKRRGVLLLCQQSPAARFALVVGQCLGAATLSLLLTAVLVALSPLVGLDLAGVSWPLLLGVSLLSAVGLAAAALLAAWLCVEPATYLAVTLGVAMPLWALSGALAAGPSFWACTHPLGYLLGGLRTALGAGASGWPTQSPWWAMLVLTVSAGAMLGLASWVCRSAATARSR